jgi:RNA polymerase sigma-70 factor (ECF subfamily)
LYQPFADLFISSTAITLSRKCSTIPNNLLPCYHDYVLCPQFLFSTGVERLSTSTVLRGLISTVAAAARKADLRTEGSSLHAAPEPADEFIMDRVQAGDQQALGLLYDRYARLILSVGLRILRDASEAQELVQDVFLYVFQKSQDFDASKSQLRSWLIQIAYSRAFNKREYLLLRRFYDYCHIDDIIDSVPSRFSAEQNGENAELRKLLQAAFAVLSQVQRTTLEMFFWEGYSLREISVRLGETFGNTRNHYYRGLERLREVLNASLAPSRNGRK